MVGLNAGGGEASEGGVRRLRPASPHRIMTSGEACGMLSVIPIGGEVGAW